jgi:hypothetical protein
MRCKKPERLRNQYLFFDTGLVHPWLTGFRSADTLVQVQIMQVMFLEQIQSLARELL